MSGEAKRSMEITGFLAMYLKKLFSENSVNPEYTDQSQLSMGD